MKTNKKQSFILMIIFFVIGIICIIFSKDKKVLSFLSFLFWGIGFLCLGRFSIFQYQENLIKLDKKLNNMLKDVELKGQQSEYYEKIDDEKTNKILKKYMKNSKYTYISLYVFGVVLIFIGVVMLI